MENADEVKIAYIQALQAKKEITTQEVQFKGCFEMDRNKSREGEGLWYNARQTVQLFGSLFEAYICYTKLTMAGDFRLFYNYNFTV